MSWKKVYHTTSKGNGVKIIKDGFKVSPYIIHGQIYGRGIYFWELKEDAHNLGKFWFGEDNYDIVIEDIKFKKNNIIEFSHEYLYNDPDSISNNLLKKGIQIIIVSNPLIEDTTFKRAKGKAFIWLVDIKKRKMYF